MNIYQKKGYKNRLDYLKSLSLEYDCPLKVVYAVAEMLGESEDFDGLIICLDDY